VLLIAGALRCRKETISEMWTTDESIRRAIFTAAMARNKFAHIFRCTEQQALNPSVHQV
jgi:hypothetical protein